MSDRDVWELAWHDQAFQVRVASADGQAYQTLFADVMERAHPGDFQRVRTWGALGDEKADGYLVTSATVFQCYAPVELTKAGTEAKIDRDLAGAIAAWKDDLRAWVFVHNDATGSPSWLIQKRSSLAGQHPDIDIQLWGPADLWTRVRALDAVDRIALLGAAPPFEQAPRDTARDAYQDHIGRWTVLAALDTWDEWTANLFHADRPTLRQDHHDRLVTLGRWLHSRVWPDGFTGVRDALMNFMGVLGDLLEVFHRHDEVDGDWRRTVRYYANRDLDDERYDRLASDYQRHVGLVQDLGLELTRAANYVCDVVRRDLDPAYRTTDGVLTVTVGPDEGLNDVQLRAEYPDERRPGRPYPGLEAFEVARGGASHHPTADES